MSSPFAHLELLNFDGTSNITGTLDSSGADTDELDSGVWMIWATQDLLFQLNTASGAGFGATPTAWPRYYPVVVRIGQTSRYLAIKRLSADGTYYANKIALGEV